MVAVVACVGPYCLSCDGEAFAYGSVFAGCVARYYQGEHIVYRTNAADTADIAGVPGTGKTATVHAVVKELKRKAEDGASLYLYTSLYKSDRSLKAHLTKRTTKS